MQKTTKISRLCLIGLTGILSWGSLVLAEEVVLDFDFPIQQTFTYTHQPYEGGDRGVTIRSYSEPLTFDTGAGLDTCSEPWALKNGFSGEMGCSDGDDLRFYLNGYTSDRISVNMGTSGGIWPMDDITATLKGYANLGGTLVEIPGLAPVSLYLGNGLNHIADNELVLVDSQGRIGAFTISYGPNCEVEKVDCVTIRVWEGEEPPPPVDPDPPVILITTPEEGEIYGRSRIMVSGTVQEAMGLELLVVNVNSGGYMIDIDSQIPPDYRFAQMVELLEGANEIRVRARDVGGNEVNETRHIVHTPYPPPPPDPPASLDIEATGMEVTQGIQGWEMIHYTDFVDRETAKLISGKKTLVRVYAEAKGTSFDIGGVTCKLEGFVGGPGGTTLPGSPLYVSNPVTLLPGENYIQQREDRAKSFNFILPDIWTDPGHITLVATVNHGQPIMERPGKYDALNSHYKTVAFHDTEEFCVFIYRIFKGHEAPLPPMDDCYANLAFTVKTYPVVPDKLNIVEAGMDSHPSGYDLNDGKDLTKALRKFRRHCGFWHGRARAAACANESYIGLTHDTNRHRGVTHSEFPVSLSVASTDPSEGTNRFYRIKTGHEIGHAQGLGHVDSYSDACSSTDTDGNHEPKEPYEDYPVHRDPSGIYYDAASIGQWGVDIRPDNTFSLMDPWVKGDMMSYCGSQRFMSIHTWNRLAAKFGAAVPDTTPMARTAAAGDAIAGLNIESTVPHLITDGIIMPDNTAELYPAWQDQFKNGTYDYPGSGPYAVHLLDKEDKPLFSRYFDKKPLYNEERFSSFSQIVPYKAGTRKICLTGPDGFQPICLSPGAEVPLVTLNSPKQGEILPAKGAAQIYWSASDPNQDDLLFTLFYSHDNGNTWRVVADEVTETSLALPLDHLPAGTGTCLLRILATDGINQGEDISAAFTKLESPPSVRIVRPRPVAVFTRKTPVTLYAVASDPDQMPFPPSGITWYSDRDGYLGQGRQVESISLRSGMHEITCIAMDDAGNSGRDVTRVFIEPTPFADITDDGHDGPVTILPTDHLKIRCDIDAAEDAVPGDYWLFVRTPSHNTWFWYDNQWTGQEIPWRQGKIEDIGPMTMMAPTGTDLPGGEKGRYVFFWGTDTIADGSVNWSDFYYDTLTVVVDDGQANTIILTRTSPDHIVTAGSAAKVYGTSGSNQITLEKGAKAEMINFHGQNLINIQSDAGSFTITRSGTLVTFQGSDGTLLKVPATTEEQTLLFGGADPLVLRIHENQVMLGEQVIDNTPAPISLDGSGN